MELSLIFPTYFPVTLLLANIWLAVLVLIFLYFTAQKPFQTSFMSVNSELLLLIFARGFVLTFLCTCLSV